MLKRSAFVINSSISREIFSAILCVLSPSGYRSECGFVHKPLFRPYFITPSNFASKSSLSPSTIYDDASRQSFLEAEIIFRRVRKRLSGNNDLINFVPINFSFAHDY